MLTIFGQGQKFCDGLTRRNFLKIGALGAGLSLADILRLRAAPGAPAPRAKSVIMVLLNGGPSHIDTYDLKPDSPAEFRGEFKPIPTNVPGIQICEHLPLQAKMWDKFSVIRSVHPIDGAHTESGITTGFSEPVNRIEHHPTIGCVISKVRGDAGAIPPYVNLRDPGLEEPGFLGVAQRPFHPRGPALDDLRLGQGMNMSRLEDRKRLLAGFDNLRRDVDNTGTMNGMDAFNARAFDMVASGAVGKALDASKEEPRVRDRYKGVEEFLLARRLVEAGVGCVTLGMDGSVWDTHFNNFKTLNTMLPKLDRALSNLVGDLHERGLQDDVLTLVCGEFGRTPRINKDAGRDHWGEIMSVVVAGGGLKMGQAIGASDAHADRPKDRPYRFAQILSTIYQTIGIDPARTFNNASGRPMYLLDDRDPVTELL